MTESTPCALIPIRRIRLTSCDRFARIFAFCARSSHNDLVPQAPKAVTQLCPCLGHRKKSDLGTGPNFASQRLSQPEWAWDTAVWLALLREFSHALGEILGGATRMGWLLLPTMTAAWRCQACPGQSGSSPVAARSGSLPGSSWPLGPAMRTPDVTVSPRRPRRACAAVSTARRSYSPFRCPSRPAPPALRGRSAVCHASRYSSRT